MAVCPEATKLVEEVQRALGTLAQLMSVQREALVQKPETALLAVDRDIERQFGEKERAMGAPLQHRKEHGCWT